MFDVFHSGGKENPLGQSSNYWNNQQFEFDTELICFLSTTSQSDMKLHFWSFELDLKLWNVMNVADWTLKQIIWTDWVSSSSINYTLNILPVYTDQDKIALYHLYRIIKDIAQYDTACAWKPSRAVFNFH